MTPPPTPLQAMRKSGIDPTLQDYRIMDAERINLISNQLADLSTRVNELRGYL
jgi:hypothetical protein